MKFEFKVNCVAVAFEGAKCLEEVIRLLRATAERLDEAGILFGAFPLRDVNGETCGSFGFETAS